ncbi:hypothetical protein [Escherichia coli]|uniref:hypothetical protein n=1 Tax=Escherichia coli TaxID=562 RepID=UPI001CBF8B1F|nr:hypothetical protein [Escherichia coli]UAP51214.1 hypothetical protein J6O57_12145 [Escherichia coli]UAP55595.1 hypothetical protein J6O05_12140 [Escherichia coli]HBR3033964.1 hypothetical protein [Klebsiella pneumoniae]HBR4168511.1 hypothetical protein [Klebsiella pneumoniae]
MSEKDYDHLHRIDRPEFIEWYFKVVNIVKENKYEHDVSYKGLWVDLYEEGLTPEEAIEKKTQMS